MAYQRLVPPIAEPVTLAQAKNFLRVDFPDDDLLISGLISAARSWCEQYTERYFVSQTWRFYMDAFPGYQGRRDAFSAVVRYMRLPLGTQWAFSLPFPPCTKVLQLQYLDANGVTQTLQQGVSYQVDLASQPARLAPAYSTFWPVTQFVPNACWCDFVCGYGSPQLDQNGQPLLDQNGNYQAWVGADVPAEITTAILFLTASYYQTRDSGADAPGFVRDLLYLYRDLRY